MNVFKVSNKIFLNHSVDIVWDVVSSKNALELYHPFCLKNDVIEHKKKDELIYLNGLTYIREFTTWQHNKGFELYIGKKNGKQSKVLWELKSIKNGCEIQITIFPYRTNKIAKLIYPFVSLFVIKPKLKIYLESVLKGLEYYLDHELKVEKNQFGTHPWFSEKISF